MKVKKCATVACMRLDAILGHRLMCIMKTNLAQGVIVVARH